MRVSTFNLYTSFVSIYTTLWLILFKILQPSWNIFWFLLIMLVIILMSYSFQQKTN